MMNIIADDDLGTPPEGLKAVVIITFISMG